MSLGRIVVHPLELTASRRSLTNLPAMFVAWYILLLNIALQTEGHSNNHSEIFYKALKRRTNSLYSTNLRTRC